MNKNSFIRPSERLTKDSIHPDYLTKLEFGEIAELRKGKFNPLTSYENKRCIELEHFEQKTGKIIGWTNSSEQKSIKNVFHKGDVLFGKLRPYLCKYWLAEFDGVCSSEVWVLKTKKNTSKEYLFNIIQSHAFIQAANVSSGSKMPRADWNYVESFPITIIKSLSEQQRIAKILAAWNKAIKLQQQLIENKTQYKKAVMKKLLTGEMRFKGFNEEWKEVRLSKVGKIINGLTYKPENVVENGVLVLRSSNVKNNKIELVDNVFVNVTDFNPVKLGDILICVRNGSRSLIGKNAMISAESEGNAFGAFMTVYRSDYNAFFVHIFDSDIFKKEVNKNLGATINSINNGDLKKFKMPFPSPKEQQKIASFLSGIDSEINGLEKELLGFQKQKQGLMQQLLTGKIRVSN